MFTGQPSNRCPEGFSLDMAGPFCIDDDECARMKPCSHSCNNVLGSYFCSCPVGMTLGPDGKSCEGIQIQYVYLHVCPSKYFNKRAETLCIKIFINCYTGETGT